MTTFPVSGSTEARSLPLRLVADGTTVRKVFGIRQAAVLLRDDVVDLMG